MKKRKGLRFDKWLKETMEHPLDGPKFKREYEKQLKKTDKAIRRMRKKGA